jgi:hypothetical protein
MEGKSRWGSLKGAEPVALPTLEVYQLVTI